MSPVPSDAAGGPLERLRRGGVHIVLGRAGLDLYAEPPGASVEEAETFRAALGGSSANIAVALVKSGAKAMLVTRVADDAIGRRCAAEVARYGVDATRVRPVDGPAKRDARNSLAVIAHRVEGFQSTIYRNGAADFLMDETDVADLPLDGAASLVLTGTVLAAEPSRGAAMLAIERAHAAGVPVVFDVDYRPYSWGSSERARAAIRPVVQASTLAVGNDEEWEWLAGGEVEYHGAQADGPDPEALRHATETARDRVVVFKRGRRGSLTLVGGAGGDRLHRFETPAHPVETAKPIGAGDAFLGALLAHVAGGMALEDAVNRGAAAAAITVAGHGCAPAIPTAAAVTAFLEARA